MSVPYGETVLAVVDELERLAVVLPLEEGDDLLQRIARGRADAQLVTLDLDLHLELLGLDILVDLAGNVLFDAF